MNRIGLIKATKKRRTNERVSNKSRYA